MKTIGWCYGAVILAASATGASAQGFQTEAVRGRFLFDIGPTVNRVEGIPLFVGLALQTIQDRPVLFEARTIVRIDDGIPVELDRVGFRIFLEKALLPERALSLGVAGWSEVNSIEDRGLSNAEASLGALLFKDDRRDYYEGIGLAVYGRVSPSETPFRGVLQYQFERSHPLAVGSVSSLFRNSRRWPRQPLASEGDLHLVAAIAEFDTRPRTPDGPFNGWYVRFDVSKAVSGSLETPPVRDANDLPTTAVPEPDNRMATGTIDVRRYNAIGDLSINLRGVMGGSLKNRPLPPQFQHTPGGTGTVPGYAVHELDCGARTPDTFVTPERPTLSFEFNRFYGCDRYMLAQAEIIGYFGFRIATDENRSVWDGPSDVRINLEPRWVIFSNAARGWTMQDQTIPFAFDEDWIYDIGAGILLGDVGVYGAYPLTGDNQKIKIAIRLRRRF